MTVQFTPRELLDFGAAWAALSVAFTVFFYNDVLFAIDPMVLVRLFGLSLLTVGVGFLLHELAHKLTAIRFGQIAFFRADYGMLLIAIVSALAGFIFAAPGAVYHQGGATAREDGLIALAGPVTNLGLALLFFPLMAFDAGFLARLGSLGVVINLFLAGFNMLPFGPLDGKTVLNWSKVVFAAVFVPSLVLAFYAMFGIGLTV